MGFHIYDVTGIPCVNTQYCARQIKICSGLFLKTWAIQQLCWTYALLDIIIVFIVTNYYKERDRTCKPLPLCLAYINM